MKVEELKTELRWRLATLRPTPAIIRTIASVDDIFAHRHHLRGVRYTPDDLKHLLDVLLSALAEERRFRQVDCLKVLKHIIKHWPSDDPFSADLTDRLFRIYTHYVYSTREELQWAVSVMLKGRILRDEQVRWLIEHYQDSHHILNRLLRYPQRPPQIVAWARKTLSEPSALPDRRGELLGLLINYSIPRAASRESSTVVAWAIYYSAAPDTTKARLLKRAFDRHNLWDIVEIAQRSDYPDVIDYLINHIEKAAPKIGRAARHADGCSSRHVDSRTVMLEEPTAAVGEPGRSTSGTAPSTP
jgi:hypothetical protein